MSNWLKKVLGKFKVEEDQDSLYNNESNIPSSNLNKKTSDAKVAYHYPKGNFRFPVIPDQQSKTPDRIEVKNQYNKRQSEKLKSINKTEQTLTQYTQKRYEPRKKYNNLQEDNIVAREGRRVPKREIININETDKRAKSEKIEPSKSKQPFRPSEIPSPIYGFKNRLLDDETINRKGDEGIGQGELGYEPILNQEISSSAGDVDFAESKNNYIETLDEVDESNEIVFANDKMDDNDDANVDLGEEPQFSKAQHVKEFADVLISEQEVEENNISEITLDVDEKYDRDSTKEMKDTNVAPHFEIEEKVQAEYEKNKEVLAEEKVPAKQEDPLTNRKETKVQQRPKTYKDINYEGKAVPYNVLMLKRDKQKYDNTVDKDEKGAFQKPSLTLLNIPKQEVDNDQEWLQEQSELLDVTLENFNVRAKVVGVTKGPAVTRFEVQPEPGVKVNKITNLADDIKLSLSAKDIRIEAPIPGTNKIGIEVPNKKSQAVFIREILRSPQFLKSDSPLTVAMGLDIAGQPVVTDLNKMPHGLIAGATGSGKSVCINSIILSLVYKASPLEVKMLLIDPKMVELAPYNGIPHLISPVITDVKAATASLKWAVDEMERRYELFAHEGVRNIGSFNDKVDSEDGQGEKMPFIVIIIDELADLMMVSPQDVEDSVCRIAQKARACGIHLLLATQRPSVDVITGLIKANIPTRVAFSVSSQVDSRTILDSSGAEKLLGKGDMLFLENGSSKPVRIQGNFVSDDEIDRTTAFVKKQMSPNYLFEQEELIKQRTEIQDEDEIFDEAFDFVVEQQTASASSLQRKFHIGYNRAARLIDMMESQGIVSESKGSKPRDVLVSKSQLEEL